MVNVTVHNNVKVVHRYSFAYGVVMLAITILSNSLISHNGASNPTPPSSWSMQSNYSRYFLIYVLLNKMGIFVKRSNMLSNHFEHTFG